MLDEAIGLVLVRLPANVVIQRAANLPDKRRVDLGAHAQALHIGLDAGRCGDFQPGHEGLKLGEQLVGELENNDAGLCLGDHRMLLAAVVRRCVPGDDQS